MQFQAHSEFRTAISQLGTGAKIYLQVLNHILLIFLLFSIMSVFMMFGYSLPRLSSLLNKDHNWRQFEGMTSMLNNFNAAALPSAFKVCSSRYRKVEGI